MFLRHTRTATSNVDTTAGTTANARAEGCKVRGAISAATAYSAKGQKMELNEGSGEEDARGNSSPRDPIVAIMK